MKNELILKVNKNLNILSRQNIENKIIFGDTFKTIEKLPNNFIDLLIVDPPYNLLKTYGSSKFKEMKNDEYYKFTYEWLSKIKNKLTKNASIYVCCDWKSSNIIFNVLNELFPKMKYQVQHMCLVFLLYIIKKFLSYFLPKK